MPFLIIKEDVTMNHAEAAPRFAGIYRGLDGKWEGRTVSGLLPEFAAIYRSLEGTFSKKTYLYNKYMEYLRQTAAALPETTALRIYPGDGHGRVGKKSFRAAIAAVRDFLLEFDRMVYIVLVDKREFPAGLKHSRAVARYLDKHYIPLSIATCEKCNNYIPFSAARRMDDLMEHLGETFSQRLFRLIDERELKDSDVYRRANIDRRHFSKIRNNKDYAPNKRTVQAFAIALELSLDETKDLLMSAGFAFSNSSKSDVILRYYIEEQNYDIFEINETLFAYNQPLLR